MTAPSLALKSDMKSFIGIDPGGVKAFGLCVMDAAIPALSVSRIVTDTCSGISEAISEIDLTTNSSKDYGHFLVDIFFITIEGRSFVCQYC